MRISILRASIARRVYRTSDSLPSPASRARGRGVPPRLTPRPWPGNSSTKRYTHMTQVADNQTGIASPTKLLINGEWVAPAAGKYYDDPNPSTGETIARVAEGSTEDVDRAVKAARPAFEKWSAMHPADRGRLLNKLGELVRGNAQQLAAVDAIASGKPGAKSLVV